MTDYQVMRDYWDRPIVFPPDVEPPYVGEWKNGRDRAGRPKRWFSTKQGTGYGRASGAGKALDSKDGLVDWAACQAAVGVLLDDGARSEVTTLINEYDGDPWYQGDDGGTRSGKQRLKDAVERARNTAGANTRASAGTEMHKLGEMVNQGKKPRIVQEHLRAPLREYVSAVSKVNFIHQELFVVNDALKRAGSVDYLMELPAGLATPDGIKHDEPIVVVGDLKTGKWDADRPMSVTCQLTVYGRGFRYDQEANTRSPLHPRINNDWGVMVHFPIMSADPRVKFYWVDLNLGQYACELSNDVEDLRKRFERKASQVKEFVL